MKTHTVVGWGPISTLLPAVPDFLIVEDGPSLVVLRRTGPTDEFFEKDGWSYLKEQVVIDESEWIAVEDASTVKFPQTEEPAWRSKRSQEIVAEVGQIKGDPVRVIRLIHTSSALQKFDLSGLSRRLHLEKKDPDQPLTSVYEALQKK